MREGIIVPRSGNRILLIVFSSLCGALLIAGMMSLIDMSGLCFFGSPYNVGVFCLKLDEF